ncbi:hypothetical protein BDY17DRAFT_51171 [Neohortaea acidophila]|uniref:Uncharacterized protein n=1 Tax=Neohortaea acidophila TaxID=245834 RepID=A0A6A6PGQ4_9PEZI|nr:uncharacterized protein BDY17DRAFT_51171 [Neohortaea acidophila]KAF2479178.1 hypothetical protein BDY17DRAFT_51171 [Neohortaea acidophila]
MDRRYGCLDRKMDRVPRQFRRGRRSRTMEELAMMQPCPSIPPLTAGQTRDFFRLFIPDFPRTSPPSRATPPHVQPHAHAGHDLCKQRFSAPYSQTTPTMSSYPRYPRARPCLRACRCTPDIPASYCWIIASKARFEPETKCRCSVAARLRRHFITVSRR